MGLPLDLPAGRPGRGRPDFPGRDDAQRSLDYRRRRRAPARAGHARGRPGCDRRRLQFFWIARRSSAKVKPQLDKVFKNEKIAVAWDMLQSSPGLLIVAGRYVPGMRFAVNASRGVSTMPYRRFLPWSILGGDALVGLHMRAGLQRRDHVGRLPNRISDHLRAGYVGHARGHPLRLPAQAEARRGDWRAGRGGGWRAGRGCAAMTSTPQAA